MFIGGHKYNLNKLKIGIGVCSGILGIALINGVHSGVVHADAINWDNQNAESSNAAADKVVSQSTNNVKTSNVQSTTSIKQNYVSALRVSPRVSNVQAGQVNKTKIAQFNSNSKIYGLNNSNTLSKNNGDGYVITNAGTYKGHQVDIGVTINNVQNNQGSYTTKWSNGDKATQTGKVDNNFSYQNGVIVNSNAVNPVINSGQTQIRNRIENQNKTYQLGKVYVGIEVNDGRPGYYGYKDMYVLDPVDLAKELAKRKISPDDNTSVMKVAGEMLQPRGGGYTGFYDAAINNGKYVVHIGYNSNDGGGTYDDTYTLQGIPLSEFKAWFDKNKKDFVTHWSEGTGNDPGVADMGESDALYIYNHMHDITGTKDVYDPFTAQPFDASDGTKLPVWKPYYKDTGVYNDATANCYSSDGDLVQDGDVLTPNEQNADLSIFGNDFVQNANYNFASPVEVADHLQIDQVKNGNLDYNYTIGLYDHDTGDLITSLKPEYKNGVKVGKTASVADAVMNRAIKNKIADIRNNKAAVAFNGTAANDDVAFYQETTPVQDVSKLTATASRTITLHFPNNQRPASYNDVVNSNNQIVQTLKFTRTGTTDLVTGQTTYTNWQGDTKFPYILLPKIPGFKLQIS